MSTKDMIRPQFNLLGQYMAKQFFEDDDENNWLAVKHKLVMYNYQNNL